VQKICFWLALLLLLGQPARAQSRVFLSADMFADAQHFSGDAVSTLNARTIGWGGSVGALVTEHWDVRTEFERGDTTTLMRPLLPPVTSFQARTRTRIAAASLLAGFHPVSRSRVQVTVLGGVSFLHVTTQLDSIPPGLVVDPHTQIDNVAAPTIGAEVALVLFRHLSVVPELRAHAFKLSERPGGFAIRPGVGIRWSM
jgi:hypothetical protein